MDLGPRDFLTDRLGGAPLGGLISRKLERPHLQQLHEIQSAVERIGDRGRTIEWKRRPQPAVDLGHEAGASRDPAGVELGQAS